MTETLWIDAARCHRCGSRTIAMVLRCRDLVNVPFTLLFPDECAIHTVRAEILLLERDGWRLKRTSGRSGGRRYGWLLTAAAGLRPRRLLARRCRVLEPDQPVSVRTTAIE